ncbi:LAME_0C01530g1_1 [Lachancea meyersii CBS 8951]|uniref:LAME_0C01530g1_1 n=1 Tax=Lachancea meyersii CBS 8951 TaxID=1266667 RepID=A0A1G4IZ33_9SACH|nr:LAME_0C01530g1_1 [Lachancea meyersii CBS 8951]
MADDTKTKEASTCDLRLPRDIFQNRFYYQVLYHKFLLIAILSYSGGWLMARFSGTAFDVMLIITIAGCLVPLAVISILVQVVLDLWYVFVVGIAVAYVKREVLRYYFIRKFGWDATVVRSFMLLISEMDSGQDLAKWDIIAAKMNSILNTQSWWATPYYFYDGQSCHSLFSANFYGPHVNNAKYFPPETRSFIDSAVKVYMQALNKQQPGVFEESSTEKAEVESDKSFEVVTPPEIRVSTPVET